MLTRGKIMAGLAITAATGLGLASGFNKQMGDIGGKGTKTSLTDEINDLIFGDPDAQRNIALGNIRSTLYSNYDSRGFSSGGDVLGVTPNYLHGEPIDPRQLASGSVVFGLHNLRRGG